VPPTQKRSWIIPSITGVYLASGVVLGCSEHQWTALSQVFRWRLEPKQVTASDPNNDKTHAYVKFNLSFTKANKGRAGREIFIPLRSGASGIDYPSKGMDSEARQKQSFGDKWTVSESVVLEQCGVQFMCVFPNHQRYPPPTSIIVWVLCGIQISSSHSPTFKHANSPVHQPFWSNS